MPDPLPPSARKPKECQGCSLADRGHGFVPPEGPVNAPIVWLGEGPGYDEVAMGRPFIGAAGSMLERILRRNRVSRESFQIGNVIQCCPPGMRLEHMPWQHTAIAHCKVHRDTFLNAPHQVILAAGGTALKTLLGLHGHERVRVEEFHGTVHWSEEYQKWVVPTFHPSFLQRGAHNLMGTVSFDLQVAMELARGEWAIDPMELVIDPAPDWFNAWGEQVLAAALHDPDSVMVASDLETPDKKGGKPENELGPDDTSYVIERWNFACRTDQGVTVPNDPRYQPMVRRILAAKCRHLWWNGSGYDWDRANAGSFPLDPEWQLDSDAGRAHPAE